MSGRDLANFEISLRESPESQSTHINKTVRVVIGLRDVLQAQVANSGSAVKYGPGPVAEFGFWGQRLESIV